MKNREGPYTEAVLRFFFRRSVFARAKELSSLSKNINKTYGKRRQALIIQQKKVAIMATIQENTVSSVNQMGNSSELSFLGNPLAAKRILVVGNSITRHGPLSEIGWENDWGMAASALEKDYVHRLYAMLRDAGQYVLMRIRQCSYWEGNFDKEDVLSRYDEERAFDADIVVFRLGENVRTQDQAALRAGLERFASHICPSGKMIFVTCFWENPLVDEVIRSVAKERGDLCLNGFLAYDNNMALGQFWHEGVSIHPSDAGMEKIAKLIFDALIHQEK